MSNLKQRYRVGLKRVAAVEVTTASNQHEFNGVSALKGVLGTTRRSWDDVLWVLLGDAGEHRYEHHTLTWYDSRENNPDRSAEWRLYYADDDGAHTAVSPADLLVILRADDENLVFVVAAAGSTWDAQLQALFGVVDEAGGRFIEASLDSVDDSFAEVATDLFTAIGWVEDPAPAPDPSLVERARNAFGGTFPTSRVFSSFVRAYIDADPNDPDGTIVCWWRAEEGLFRSIENTIVEQRLASGFISVDDFISYSLSVQNRRKARAGLAFENHIEALLQLRGLTFSRNERTEGNRTPDFLLPGINQYRDGAFPAGLLSMLAAKTTCKDRWRQVLTEAERIPRKHLCTLEPAISEAQFTEMREESLTIVAPITVLETYPTAARAGVLSVGAFLELAEAKQKRNG